MTESSNHDSNQIPKNNELPVEDELDELRSLLLTPQMQQGLGDASAVQDNPETKDELGELRSLLLAPQVQQGLGNASGVRDNSATIADDLSELRSLLLGFERSELEKLRQLLNNPNIQVQDISRMLPEAVILRTIQDKQLAEAMVPTVEEAIQFSVKKDLTILANAIFPVIGPAIRKAIATALETMIESLNQTVEHSLSPQSFKWRLEALQTGKSFVEVVLLRTLLYRVEQVFLIHKQTGILLQHVVAPAVAAQDADLVSAMLTAIQDFVRDSFSVQTNDGLKTLQFGDLTIWIEQSPQAILASVIRGHPPNELKLVFQDTIEKFHLKFVNNLNSFQGDVSQFDASRPDLEACLQTQYKPKKEKRYSSVWSLLGVVAIALGIWSFFSIRERLQWAAYLEKLHAQRGIVVTSAQKQQGKYFISGLRDPLATDPVKLLSQVNLNPNEVTSHWEPYLSLDSEFVAKRAKQVLQPPATVSLKVDENRILHATGSAPRQWIVETRKLVRVIPGITKFQEDNLVVAELWRLESAKKQVEKQVLLFEEGTTQLIPNQEQKLQSLVREIKNIFDTASVLGKNVSIEIVGRTDKHGVEQTNMELSQARASAILSFLVSQGLKATNFSILGVGARKPLRNELTLNDRAFNRSITFKVILIDASNKEADE